MFNRLAASIVCVALAAGLCLAGAASQPAMSKEVADANAVLDAMQAKYGGRCNFTDLPEFRPRDSFQGLNGMVIPQKDCVEILKALFARRAANADSSFVASKYSAFVQYVMPANAASKKASTVAASLTKPAGTMKPTITFP